MMMPRVRAYSAAAVYSFRDASRSWVATSSPTSSAQRSKLMFSSWSPSAALVDGVKIGSGILDASVRPAGSLMPQTVPSWSYVFLPEPVR